MKLPDKKYVPKHNEELRRYAIGWNSNIEDAEYLCNEYDDEYAKESLLRKKEDFLLMRKELPLLKGIYDCIIEIERLNEEQEYRLDNFFQDSLDALDKLNIRGE